MAHCAGNPIFGNLNLPEILVENILALKPREYSKKGGKNPLVYLPVVGRYFRDTLPDINVLNADGSIFGPLFSSPPEPPIDFIDCTSGGLPVNVQGTYYQVVLDDWNENVNKFKQFSSTIQPMIGDAGPRGLLSGVATRLLKRLDPPDDMKIPQLPARISQSLQFCQNKPYDPMKVGSVVQLVKKKPLPKNVMALPDATVLELITDTILSRFPVSQEMYELFNVIILPTDRPDDTNDVLNQAMIQVMGLETYSYEMSATVQTVSGTGAGEWNRLNSYANELITGLARDDLTKFQQIFRELISKGEAGFLGALLGPIANAIFPGNEAVINTIGGFLP